MTVKKSNSEKGVQKGSQVNYYFNAIKTLEERTAAEAAEIADTFALKSSTRVQLVVVVKMMVMMMMVQTGSQSVAHCSQRCAVINHRKRRAKRRQCFKSLRQKKQKQWQQQSL